MLTLPTDENPDKKSLIQSMKKLSNYVSDNSNRQTQIFRTLSPKDLNRLLSYLKDQNQYLRRVTILSLCQLLYNNNINKNRFIDKLQIFPKYGRVPKLYNKIVINQLPIDLLSYPETLKKCITMIKEPIKPNQENCFCWVINLDRKNLSIEFLEYKNYTSFTFFDPMRCIVGVTVKSYVDSMKFKNIRIKTGIDEENSRKSYSRESHGTSTSRQYRIRKYDDDDDERSSKLIILTKTHKKQQNHIKVRNRIQEISQYARQSYGAKENPTNRNYRHQKRCMIDEDMYSRRSKSKSPKSRNTFEYPKSRSKQHSKDRHSYQLSSQQKKQTRLKSTQKFFDRIKSMLKQ